MPRKKSVGRSRKPAPKSRRSLRRNDTTRGKVPPNPKKKQPSKHGKKQQHKLRSQVPAPGEWWRKPIPSKLLRDFGGDDNAVASAVALERYKRVQQLKEYIRELREYSDAYGPADYPLDTRKLIRLSPAKISRLKKDGQTLRSARANYYVAFTPHTELQLKNTIKLAGRPIISGQTTFLVHIQSSAGARGTYVNGVPRIEDKVKGGKLMRDLYLFPRRYRDWDTMSAVLEDMLETVPDGYYQVYNSVYGPVGGLATRQIFLSKVEASYSTYDASTLGTMLGIIRVANTFNQAERIESKNARIRRGIEEMRLKRMREERQRVADRLYSPAKKLTPKEVTYYGDPKRSDHPDANEALVKRRKKSRATYKAKKKAKPIIGYRLTYRQSNQKKLTRSEHKTLVSAKARIARVKLASRFKIWSRITPIRAK